MAARSMIERKTVINLLEAFAVSLKHYLRGEDGIFYQDLYHLVKFLPAYALPLCIPSAVDGTNGPITSPSSPRNSPSLPVPATSRKTSFLTPVNVNEKSFNPPKDKAASSRGDGSSLLPAYNPPKYHLFDLFPFSLLMKWLTRSGREVKGKAAAKLRARIRETTTSHNIPLEMSLYLSSYIAALQNRKQADPQTISNLFISLNQLVDALTGLERILTTPIPFSYSTHLWIVSLIYCFALPFQTWSTLNWLTIPATIIVSFAFFGFLVAGEEIENPFGYDKNDLNLDHFTGHIIRNELRAITSAPPPNPSRWAFATENDSLISSPVDGAERITPEVWMKRGNVAIQKAMSAL
ncbi:hypothetical protein C0993_000843 [Termitomyces sp. T159_Od127]|nr:hypothetical protein C0993_000843 [Termitomyces sp. T159_Od127]